MRKKLREVGLEDKVKLCERHDYCEDCPLAYHDGDKDWYFCLIDIKEIYLEYKDKSFEVDR